MTIDSISARLEIIARQCREATARMLARRTLVKWVTLKRPEDAEVIERAAKRRRKRAKE